MADRDDEQFQGLVLRGVESLDQELGRGAYGRVYKVKYCEATCAAKEIHSILVEGVGQEEMRHTIDLFLRECHQCSRLRHPNIIQFLGVYYPQGGIVRTRLPVMVMEIMACSLTSLVNEQQNIPNHIKYSIINDVSLGLCYLHSHNPPIVHRDLSPNNILLTNHYVAKISDLGVAKAIQVDNRRTVTMVPGTVDFMPPETFGHNPKYGSPMDVFSFAGIILHTFSQQWPTPSKQVEFNPVTRERVALSEVERRSEYLEKMTGEAEKLRPLVEECLDDDPNVRPTMVAICKRIETNKDGLWKDSSQDVILLHHILEELKDENEQLQNQLSQVTIQTSQNEQATSKQETQLQSKETSVPKRKIESPPLVPTLISGRYHIKWTRLADLPNSLYCNCMCTAVQGHKIYVAGYNTATTNTLQCVYVYDVATNCWDRLPNPGQYYGVPHIIGGKLCIIGGRLCSTWERTNQIATFDETTHLWKSHYPNLLSARSGPGVITHLEHVIVAGGASGDGYTISDDIEVLNWIENLHWSRVSVHLPRPMFNLKMTTCGEHIFIVEYHNASREMEKGVFKIAINAVIMSNAKLINWEQIIPTSYKGTTPVPDLSPPLVVGGDNNQQTTADIQMYDVMSKKWKKVDSLTFSRTLPAVAMVGDNAIIVMGGYTNVQQGFKSSPVHLVEMGQVELSCDC